MTDTLTRPNSSVLIFAATAHGAIDILLVCVPWQLTERLLLLALAFPFSQNALIASWVRTGSWPLPGRCLLGMFGLVTTWAVACALLPIGFGSEMAVGWLVAFLIQAVVIVLAVHVWQVVLWRLKTTGHAGNISGDQNQRYSLRSLLVWMAIISTAFALVRLAALQLGWTQRMFMWEFLPHLIGIGFYNGLIAAVVFCSSKRQYQNWKSVIAAFVVVALLAAVWRLMYRLLFTDQGGITIEQLVIVATAQMVILLATLKLIESNIWRFTPN